MLFHEIYSTYFQTVAKILAEAVEHPLTTEEISAIIQDYAFEESILNIPKSLGMAHWQLLKEDGTTILRKNPTMPLTILQKRWINAIALDPRIRLFTDQPVVFSDVEPLFLPEDIYVFDKYSDGDPYENPEYIQNFRLILDAIKHQYPIQISITNRHGKRITTRTIPEYLEYSEKDDKFRLIGTGSKLGNTINLGRITSCEKCENQQGGKVGKRNQPRPRKVIFELIDERNALERVLMHFAHLEKGNVEWNNSAPHGAGRIMSRTKAKQSIDLEEYKASMQGIYSTSVNADTLDEAPMAYKSLADIIDVIRDSVEIIDIMKPVYNFKASDGKEPWKKRGDTNERKDTGATS